MNGFIGLDRGEPCQTSIYFMVKWPLCIDDRSRISLHYPMLKLSTKSKTLESDSGSGVEEECPPIQRD